MHFAGRGTLRSPPVRCHPSRQGTYATHEHCCRQCWGQSCALPWALRLCVVFVEDSMCAYCLKGQLLSSCESVYLLLWCPSVRRENCLLCPFLPPFFFNMWMLTCDVCVHIQPPPFCFRFTSVPSKPFPRKKKSTNCLLHSLLVCVCVCVCQLSPQLVFYCLLLCVHPDETVCRSLLTTHYVYCRTLTSFFFCLFLHVHGRMEVT